MSLLLLAVPNSPVHLAAATGPGKHVLLQLLLLLLLLPAPTLQRTADTAVATAHADARFRSPPPLGNLRPSLWRPFPGRVVGRGTCPCPSAAAAAAATVIPRQVALVR